MFLCLYVSFLSLLYLENALQLINYDYHFFLVRKNILILVIYAPSLLLVNVNVVYLKEGEGVSACNLIILSVIRYFTFLTQLLQSANHIVS